MYEQNFVTRNEDYVNERVEKILVTILYKRVVSAKLIESLSIKCVKFNNCHKLCFMFVAKLLMLNYE